jgi:hypothetical protein
VPSSIIVLTQKFCVVFSYPVAEILAYRIFPAFKHPKNILSVSECMQHYLIIFCLVGGENQGAGRLVAIRSQLRFNYIHDGSLSNIKEINM